MKKVRLFSLFLIFMLTACSEGTVSEQSLSVAFDKRSENGEAYLAYEHSATIDLTKSALEDALQSVVDACSEDAELVCTVLSSEINSGKHPSASIRMRLKPHGIEQLLSLAAKNGAITRKSTHVEDLAEPIIESDRQLAMLETYLESLLKLQDESKANVDALIKVASEIASTESKLEALKGEHAYLKQRVELDLLNLRFVVESSRSFWAPIGDSLDEFAGDLSSGVSDAITGFAYLLPWLFILIPLIFLVRYMWRKSR